MRILSLASILFFISETTIARPPKVSPKHERLITKTLRCADNILDQTLKSPLLSARKLKSLRRELHRNSSTLMATVNAEIIKIDDMVEDWNEHGTPCKIDHMYGARLYSAKTDLEKAKALLNNLIEIANALPKGDGLDRAFAVKVSYELLNSKIFERLVLPQGNQEYPLLALAGAEWLYAVPRPIPYTWTDYYNGDKYVTFDQVMGWMPKRHGNKLHLVTDFEKFGVVHRNHEVGMTLRMMNDFISDTKGFPKDEYVVDLRDKVYGFDLIYKNKFQPFTFSKADYMKWIVQYWHQFEDGVLSFIAVK